MTPFVSDSDFTLYVGDVRDVLAELPDSSVDCVVTSPPYWGLRDYGTGSWVGGDPDCDHIRTVLHADRDSDRPKGWDGNFRNTSDPRPIGYSDVCGKCGATRVDRQLGLEPTPEEYVENMVAVFQGVRRVLADHGTCWVNLGDSYAQGHGGSSTEGKGITINVANRADATPKHRDDVDVASWSSRDHTPRNVVPGLKPKDLAGMPWRVAFALQADGWYLRADVVWSKPNPMPESVTDRPTKAHEYVFLLSKRPRYFFDQEAVREGVTGNTHSRGSKKSPPKSLMHEDASSGVKNNRSFMEATWETVTSRNVRSVWEIATQPYPEAHFATYPEELVRRCVLAGCPEFVCGVCGKPRERIVESLGPDKPNTHDRTLKAGDQPREGGNSGLAAAQMGSGWIKNTVGWSDCGHAKRYVEDDRDGTYRPGVVLDPFLGSGTTALVARKHGRRTIGIELNPAYAKLAADRLAQQSLLAEIA